MMRWPQLLAVAVAIVGVSWGVLFLLARRLPRGSLQELAAFL